MIRSAIILAAGRGSRLKGISSIYTKAMAPVAGKPLAARVVDTLATAGIEQFIFVVSPSDQRLLAYFSTIPNCSFVIQSEPRGAGHALLQAASSIKAEHFLVSACDNLVPDAHVAQLLHVHEHTQACITLSTMEVPAETSLSALSVVEILNGQVRKIIEKPAPQERISNIMSLPLYAMSPLIFDALRNLAPSPRGEIELQGAIQQLIEQGKRVSAVTAPSRLQVTTPDDLLALNLHFLSQQTPSVIIDSSVRIPSSTTIIPPVYMGASCSIGEHAVIGPAVALEARATVAENTQIARSLVVQGARTSGNIVGQVIT